MEGTRVSPAGSVAHDEDTPATEETGAEQSKPNMPDALSGRELSSLFGVRISQLGQLAKYEVFHRLGPDRYQLDLERLARLATAESRPFLDGPCSPLRPIETDKPRTHGDERIPLGLAAFDNRHRGLFKDAVNILKIPGVEEASLAAGSFLAQGLFHGERVAVISFEHPHQVFSRWAGTGLSFDDALQSEQLVYLYYKPDIAHSLSLSVDYRELFKEVGRLSGEGVQRVVMFNVDALINTNSDHLVHTSLHQLVYAANHLRTTTLGLFVASGNAGDRLEAGCRAILPGYFALD